MEPSGALFNHLYIIEEKGLGKDASPSWMDKIIEMLSPIGAYI